MTDDELRSPMTAVFPDRDRADSAFRLVTEHGYEAHEVDETALRSGAVVLCLRPHNAEDAAAIQERWTELEARLIVA